MRLSILKPIGILVMGSILIACGGKGENRKIKEASAIHTRIMDQYDTAWAELEKEGKQIDGILSSTSTSDPNYKAYESMKRSIDRGKGMLRTWEESVVPVPGMPHKHIDAPHSHDAARDELAANMSDQEILELQQAYETRLKEVSKEINKLMDTIKLYKESAK